MSKPWRTTQIVRDIRGNSHRVELEVQIDWDKLGAALARAAFRNKSGKAILVSGVIKAKATNKRAVEA